MGIGYCLNCGHDHATLSFRENALSEISQLALTISRHVHFRPLQALVVIPNRSAPGVDIAAVADLEPMLQLTRLVQSLDGFFANLMKASRSTKLDAALLIANREI
jgi:hypothetical protein